eukprot:CAMPEP_0181371118 /NCGR_PEP_ID=MMETSP1106-20121128/13857_1 /TAXON_ID=81844 /ORGANISM="Mantoniella antarctica, Strain SL-175" /LENGTH=185 /DNA_ID=CAMNT_0023488093 /DNA_START=55 /DNA_END=612 /DNA_ORIENTATION=+
MRSSTATFAVLGAALVCAFALSAAGADAAESDSMSKYRKRTGQKFLAEKKKEEGVVKLPSGMLYKVLKASDKTTPKSPTAGDTCEVTYAGRLRDGTPFDSGTTSFAPNQVIQGWTEAMQLMCEGDKWELYIPYDLAYGERGSPPKIPSFSPLVFEIEIHKVKSGGKTCAAAKTELAKKITAAKDL